MQEIKQLGTMSWTEKQIKEMIPEFLELYRNKSIKDNQGGYEGTPFVRHLIYA